MGVFKNQGPLNPDARKPGSRKIQTTTVKNKQGKETTVESGTLNQTNFAVCSQGCGSLGGYLDARDARNAETMHRKTAHPDVPSRELQRKINRHGRGTKDWERGD